MNQRTSLGSHHTGPIPFQTFDPTEDVFITERHLPHWAQANTLCFMTFRTWDSMPGDVVRRWEADRADLLRAHGINPLSNSWKDELEQLDPLDRKVLKQRLSERWQGSLDECHGECVLRSPKFAAIVADSLRHFDGERYHLTDFVVMPNHVHVMASFVEPVQMLSQAESWRHFTATKINRLLGRRGRFGSKTDLII